MTNLEIAQAANLRRIEEIAQSAGLAEADFEPLGRYKAKLTYEGMARLQSSKRAKLILVTAMTPTPAGEGKTTVCIGLAQGLKWMRRADTGWRRASRGQGTPEEVASVERSWTGKDLSGVLARR